MAFGLTPRQRDLKKYISEYMLRNEGVAPSLAEMAEFLEVTSTSSVHRILDVLERKEHIARLKGMPRAIKVLP